MTTYTASLSKKRVSAKKFLELATKTPDRVAGAKFVPPVIGGRGFGHFELAGPSTYEVKLGR